MSNPSDLELRRWWPFALGVLELVVFVLVVGWIGFGWAVLLVLATSLVGIVVLRLAGFRAWAAVRRSVVEGEHSGGTSQIADTGVTLLAGLLLTVPGFVTDVLALVLLIPPIRRSAGKRLTAAAFRTFPGGHGFPGPSGNPGGGAPGGTRAEHQVVIEGEIVDPGPADKRDHKP